MRKFLMFLIMLIVSTGFAMAQTTVTGTVSTDDGSVLTGVTVFVEGTTIGTVTDAGGQFSIDVPAANDVLVFSFIGMQSQKVTVGDNTTINVTMKPDVIGLEEVIAIGYGTQQRGSITGAISSVSNQDIQELPVIDAGSALQGRAAGVMALSSGTRPGDGVTIRVRGRRSLTATNDPLYVVDGIPYEGNINDINPRDIKSMEILKDASATAIYGSRGANGVILITTTRGGNYPTTVTYNGYYGVTTPLAKPDMMNGAQYTQLKEVGGRAFTAEEEDAIARGVSTDWIDLVVSNGYKQSHQISVRGGDAKTAFSVSTNLYKEQAVIKTQDFTRKTLRINLDHKITDKVKIGTSTQLSDQLQNYGSNVYGAAVNISPLVEPYDADGNLVYQPDPLLFNPLADFAKDAYVDERTRLRVFSNIFAEIDLFKNLNYHMNYGVDYQKYRRGLFQGSLTTARQYSSPRALKRHESDFTYTFENILTFTKDFNENNKLKVTGLYSVQKSNYEMTQIDVEGLPYEHQLFNNLGTGTTVRGYGSDLSEWGIMSFMGRVNYDLMGKYLFTLTGRYDGSSRLAEGKKWGFFPSAAFLWRISNEEFMANQTLFSDLRLRASYGVTGNTGIDPYQTKGGLTRTIYSFGTGSGYGYRPNLLANPDLKWESSATANIGVDFGIGESVSGSVEVYQTNTSDLLLERQLPPTSGFSSVFENVGETRNRGWELTVTDRLVSTKDLTWTVDLNLFGNKEEIVDLYGDKKDDVGNRWFIGEPLTVWYDYKKIGIWQIGEEQQAQSFGQKVGEIKIQDVEPDGKINEKDRVILGTNIPKATLGLGSRLNYKHFEFSFLLLGIFGQTVYNQWVDQHTTLQGRYNNLNVNYWTEDNPTNDQPKPDGQRERPLYNSTRAYEAGDFLKVKNIQLSYNIPKKALSRIGLKAVKVYINADTPFIFSGLPNNLDPETYNGQITSDTPSIRMYSFGVNIDF